MPQKNKNIKKAKADEHIYLYDYIRIIVTILVVIGHCSTLVMLNCKGQVISNQRHMDYSKIWIDDILEMLRITIYSFHMPLFVLLSGAVFEFSFKICNINYIQKKIKRLIFPYFVVAIIIFIPIRFLVGYYSLDINFVKAIILDVIWGRDINYLWFLPMLFQVTILAAILKKFKIFDKKGLCIIVLILTWGLWAIAPQLYDLPFQIGRSAEFLFWFLLGILFEKRRESLSKHFGKYRKQYLCVFSAMFLVSQLIDILVKKQYCKEFLIIIILKVFSKIFVFITAIMGCISIIGMSNYLIRYEVKGIKKLILESSFEIYLFHLPLIYLLKWGFAFILVDWKVPNLIYLVVVIIISILSILLPVYITKKIKGLELRKRGYK
ncbi:acyltransferase [Bariatricus massiliensis]|uniref:Acyltransferase n=1 Tax=Bariatricus massiliensis TaxID=1745713 RepID=A0ABS8DI36_9FIRM|nr:acyltransferase [Bariatricus massiliensis]MCB7304624.1 acyltransferase [Bariatricus massiliensis]MCB7374775.1 acyltransferase [Bariatricus massiliensis]MCB7388098.1 acyltransferase [Bariatricus massiliensis]MCB7411940.1 acyltransferase [Bariatricus massiliensis]MCQ5254269.1 acyltransferase [Bariatricus massiliensis]